MEGAKEAASASPTIIRDQPAKQELLSSLREASKLAAEIGMASLAHDLERTRIPKLAEERFHLVVLGEFNHGKSTFVNALLGANVLPAGITPTTATINHLNWAEKPRARAHLTDGTEKDVDPTRLADWVTIEGREASHVKYVEVGWPAEILRDRLTIVDTPGVNDINEQRAEITYSYIPRADACLFLLDGAQVLKQSERAFLEQRILRRSRDKLIFILGKIDLLTAEERAEALAFCRTHLSLIVPDPAIFPISAKRWLQGHKEESGMQPLLDHLAQFLANERGRILLDNAVGDGLRLAAYVRQNLGIKRRSLTLGLEELEERIGRVHAELESKKATLRSIHEKIRAESQAVLAGTRLDLEEFADAFVHAVADEGGEIDRADGNDVRRYFQFFLQDKWKEFAEKQGEKIAAQLERLAEEIIQITNENVEDAMRTLARELGPAETHIELEVDTLKYDVGAVALGALGAGIFLFVNGLVGGILTLAAPILAIVLKDRAAERVKAQAKESAPTVIRRAAEAVGPRFEALIQEFSQRLTDFVTAAGDALHRGISEVLDTALAERRKVGIDVAARDVEIQQQLERLTRIEARFTSLRDKLWSTEGTGSAQ